jgi:hypothetical protein
LSDRQLNEARKIVSGKFDNNELLFEKTVFLSDVFAGTPADDLLFLAEPLLMMVSTEPASMGNSDRYIVWIYNTDSRTYETILVYDSNEASGIPVTHNSSIVRYLLQLNKIEEFSIHFPERAFSIYRHLDQFETKAEAVR